MSPTAEFWSRWPRWRWLRVSAPFSKRLTARSLMRSGSAKTRRATSSPRKTHTEIERRAKAASVPIIRLGATGGRVIALGDERPLPLEALIERFGELAADLYGRFTAAPRAAVGARDNGQMKRSTDRILTTHSGSLSRPPDLLALNRARAQGEKVDDATYANTLGEAVADVVRKQRDVGVDIPDDGEFGKPMASNYDYGVWWNYAFARHGRFRSRGYCSSLETQEIQRRRHGADLDRQSPRLAESLVSFTRIRNRPAHYSAAPPALARAGVRSAPGRSNISATPRLPPTSPT